MKKIKILHLVEDLKIGGLERVIESIVTGIDRDRYDAEVWCLAYGGDIAEDLAEKGIKVKILGMRSYYNPLKIIELSRLMKTGQITILHTHGYFGSTFGRLAALLIRVPVVICHVHSTYYGYTKRNILIERFLSFFTDKIVCVSESVQKFVVDIEGIDKSKSLVIYNGIAETNTDEAASPVSRKSLGISDSEIAVITVASLTPHKGHKVLIDAIHLLTQKYQNVRLLIVGDGPLRDELAQYVERLDLATKITFTGLRKDIYSLLKLSDIFVLPSLEREGLGIAIIEAMACGLPVIGARLGGIVEVIQENINGILCSPGNSDEFATAMMRLAADNELRGTMGCNGRNIYEEKFGIETMIGRIECLYEELIRENTG